MLRGNRCRHGQLSVIYNPELEIVKRENAMQDPQKYNPYNAKLIQIAFVERYFERDILEKAYKNLKSDINLHPIRQYRINHIKAHIKICYIAYAILSYMQYKLKSKDISAVKALEQLQYGYKVYLESTKDNFEWEKINKYRR